MSDDKQRGRIVAVCISEQKGTQKTPVQSAKLIADHGIEGDAHAGKWHRQVSLLAAESVRTMQDAVSIQLKPGDFAENILVDGMELKSLPVGARLKIGAEAEATVTQIGKECHGDCAIRKAAGDCVMPREGIFVRIDKGGDIKPGDEITRLS